ncbi:MAG: HEPN domain-containing protein [Armatimonadia bacterium]|nr:HEPN domain-containing protein [Armatimonadia bacterium]
MATTTVERDRLIEAIAEFMRRVDVEEAILFGSRARGEELGSSDVDLIVISPRFEGIRFTDRIAPLLGEWPRALPTLEVLAYTPEEFERARRGMRIERKAYREGVRLRLCEDSGGVAVTPPPEAQTGGRRMLDEALRWLREAETQKRAAETMAEAGIWNQAMFNARQTIELLLKAAVLELCREEPPRTHSLGELLGLVDDDPPDQIEAAVKALDPHYIMTRYPTEAIPSPTSYYDEEDAARALEQMGLVFEWVCEQLPEEEEANGGETAMDGESAEAAEESPEAI